MRAAPLLGMARRQFGKRLGSGNAGRVGQIAFGSATGTGAQGERFALRRIGAGRGTDRVTNTHQQAGGVLPLGKRGRHRGRGAYGRGRSGRIDGAAPGAAQQEENEKLSHRHIISLLLLRVKRRTPRRPWETRAGRRQLAELFGDASWQVPATHTAAGAGMKRQFDMTPDSACTFVRSCLWRSASASNWSSGALLVE